MFKLAVMLKVRAITVRARMIKFGWAVARIAREIAVWTSATAVKVDIVSCAI